MTTMARYNIAQAKARFSELVERALAGDEVVIARANKPLLRIVPYHDHRRKLRPGSARDRILEIAPDFNATPDDFAEYR
jgi:prevent-host-death family protein